MRILLNTREEEAAPYVLEQESKWPSLTTQQVLERIKAPSHAGLLEIIQQSSRGLGTDAKLTRICSLSTILVVISYYF
jgi:hypothetical protein